MCILLYYSFLTMILFTIIISSKLLNIIYKKIINNCFIEKNKLNYDKFLQIIHFVSENNYYMNYGLWNKNTTTIIDANKNLINFIFNKTVLNESILNKTNIKILDVGCGYGAQDLLLAKRIGHSGSIVAIDISKKQIELANKQQSLYKISKNKLKYIVCNALKINNKFNNSSFDVVICIESAFHYKNRPGFFKSVCNVLSNDGIFAISDIVINKNCKCNLLSNIYLKLFSDFFKIPQKNRTTTASEWKSNLIESGFDIIEYKTCN